MKTKAILCVDDEKIIISSMRQQIQSRFGDSVMVEFAYSGQEGLDIVSELNEEGVQTIIVISDWMMPGMKGDEFLIELHKRYPQIRKVMITGMADEDAIERAFHYADLKRVIQKPWREEELLKVVEDALNGI
ncbi:MAG: response regulator [Bacteroidia bacterium]|nr:response regulator [Bacteroidia bacterium]